ncbi:MAG: hypothetical protein KGL04_04335, partial [Elusimicrobia bacterium]|nr:hypothetical protein [Elusimicrobiota bacterium]
MKKSAWLLAAAAALCFSPSRARAQFWMHSASTETVAASSAPALSLGQTLSLDKGPWVLGEITFVANNQIVSNMTWRDEVRGAPGELYTKADVLSDADNLKGLGDFISVNPAVYAIPGSPIPSEYFGVAASTNEVRLVFDVKPKGVLVSSAAQAALPVPVSGMILTPTAYRGLGHFTNPGLGLDFNGTYYIGRLYGKNNYANNPTHTNYLDQVGLWLLTIDGKMQVQSEAKYRPALAFGAEGTLSFLDTSQPTPVNTAPSETVTVASNKTKILTDAYVVASKKFGPVRTSIGYMQGDMGDFVSQLSSFLSPNAFIFYHNAPGQTVRSNGIPFASVFGFPHKNMPLGVEVMQFNGAALHPVLFNFRVGAFLHANFDVGYLKFDGGYDVLGLINFRWSEF